MTAVQMPMCGHCLPSGARVFLRPHFRTSGRHVCVNCSAEYRTDELPSLATLQGWTPDAIAQLLRILDGEPIPAKKKPRGRPFQRGGDPRRKSLPKYAPGQIGALCPHCKAMGRVPPGTLETRQGRRGPFVGCTAYPECVYTQNAQSELPTPQWKDTPYIPSAPFPEPPQPSQEQLSMPQGSLDALVAEIAKQAARNACDENRVREIVAMEMAKQEGGTPRSIEIKLGELPPITVDTAHVLLSKVLKLVMLGFNVLLVGPAGSGKTMLGEQIATVLKRDFATLSCAPGLPESALLGRMIPNLSSGEERYRVAPFVECYRNGGVFLLDEVDNADASTVLVLNSALANGHLTLPSGERVTRHADFALIASANTYGHGQSREYVGRNQLDAAFLDRFVGATVSLDYDPELERALVPHKLIRERVQEVRARVRELKLRRVVSTRALVAVAKLIHAGDYSIVEGIAALTEGWSIEDKRSCGAAV